MSLTDNLEAMNERALAKMKKQVETDAVNLQNYMRLNFKWQVRSGRAHQSLTGTASETDEGFEIALSYGVDYGVYLELAHKKRYAITKPTVRIKGPEVMQGFQRLLDRLK